MWDEPRETHALPIETGGLPLESSLHASGTDQEEASLASPRPSPRLEEDVHTLLGVQPPNVEKDRAREPEGGRAMPGPSGPRQEPLVVHRVRGHEVAPRCTERLAVVASGGSGHEDGVGPTEHRSLDSILDPTAAAPILGRALHP